MLGSTLREQPPCRYIAGVRLYPEDPMRWKGALISPVGPVEIENYSDDVPRNKIRCYLPSCPVCHTESSWFTRHEARPRGFYVLCDLLIQTLRCLVIRWRCPGCKKTFTQQPPFALPRKRYSKETILDFAASYTEQETMTYRKLVAPDGNEIFHASTNADNPIDDRILAHSTPYRWITGLGGFEEIRRCAQDLILQQNPASTVCRDLAALEIPARKFVTAQRESILKRCRQILHLEAEFRATFPTSIFPFLATRCAWG